LPEKVYDHETLDFCPESEKKFVSLALLKESPRLPTLFVGAEPRLMLLVDLVLLLKVVLLVVAYTGR